VGSTPDTDFTVLNSPGLRGDAVVDHWLFAVDNAAVKLVQRNGVRLVEDGWHKDRERLTDRYGKALARLIDA
jgi:hypothetical protein